MDLGVMVTGLISASARLPKEIACGWDGSAAMGGGIGRGGRAAALSDGRGRGVRAGGSSGRADRLRRPAESPSRRGAEAAASASAKGAAAAAAVLSGVTGGASTLVRGMDCHIETGASAG